MVEKQSFFTRPHVPRPKVRGIQLRSQSKIPGFRGPSAVERRGIVRAKQTIWSSFTNSIPLLYFYKCAILISRL